MGEMDMNRIERLLIPICGLLFIITWTIVIVLMVKPNDLTLTAKHHHITEEIFLTEKESSYFIAINKKMQDENIQMNRLEDVIKFHHKKRYLY